MMLLSCGAGLRAAPPKAPWRQSVQSHRAQRTHRRRAVQTLEPLPLATGAELRPEPAPAVVYDPERERDYFDQNRLLVARRMVTVTARALQFLAAVLVDRLDAAVHGYESTDHRPAKTLQQVATKLGPCYIKLAQTLSMRPDLIGEAYAEKLSELQDSVAPFPSEEAFAILERELGRPVSEVFSWISREPVASASLGQVYRGALAGSGMDVAVKVQRPGVEGTVALDVYLLRRSIGVAQKAAGISRDLRVVADEIGRSLYGELDFRLEAENGEEFLHAHRRLPFVRIPRVVRELTTRRVLVMEWVDGQGPSQLLSKSRGAHASPAARAAILSMVRMGIQCSLSQLLVTGVMHGDPHSGNLLLARDGSLCYLDFGMLVKVPSEHRQAMMCALIHLGLGEWRRLVDDLAALDLLKPETDRRALADDLEREFSAVLTEQHQQQGGSSSSGAALPLERQLPLLSLQTSALSFRTLTAVIFRVAFKYKFLLPAYFPLVIRSVSSLEGVALLVDPNFKLISAGMPIVLHQLLSDRRPAAQQLLSELLLGRGGALRTDDTAQQIMQVWARALEQAQREGAAGPAAAGSGDPTAAPGPILLGGPSMTGPSLLTSVASSGSLSSVDLWEGEGLGGGASEGGGLDLGSLLLGRENAPLRRVLMEVNPAATVASMTPEMRVTVRQLAVDLLAPLPLAALLGRQGGEASAQARAKRKRLSLLMRASSRQVARSPPGSVLQLLSFTAQVAAAVMAVKLRQAWARLFERVRQLLAGGGQQGEGRSAEPVLAVA